MTMHMEMDSNLENIFFIIVIDASSPKNKGLLPFFHHVRKTETPRLHNYFTGFI